MTTAAPPRPPAPATPAPVPSGWRSSRPALAVLAGALAVAGTAVWAVQAGPLRAAPTAVDRTAQTVSAVAPVAAPRLSVVGQTAGGTVAFGAPLVLSTAAGSLTRVAATGPDGAPLVGSLGADGSWRSSGPLAPSSTYAVLVLARDAAGQSRPLTATVQTTAATKLVHASVFPAAGATVGVGEPVSVRLDTPVTDPAARAALIQKLQVTSAPATVGAWRWMDSRTLHYRGASFWPAGTTVTVHADLSALAFPGGAWGSGAPSTTFTVGDAIGSVVDTAAHTMTVSRNGQVLKVLPASMGRPKYPTRNGTFIVLEKFETKVMDSSTLSDKTVEAYKTTVKNAVRITNSGTFTHGAPWSVGSQGKTNVSHGCINLSPADAKWYYDLARPGDVVKVVNSTVGPLPYDAGSRDWNMSFADWKA